MVDFTIISDRIAAKILEESIKKGKVIKFPSLEVGIKEENKVYHLFAYNRFYPHGGLNDYLGSFDTIDEAKDGAISAHYEVIEIVVQRDNTLDESAELVCIEYGDGFWSDGKYLVEWTKTDA